MTSSKTLKIAIPVIAVIAIGIFLGLTALPSDSSEPGKTESTAESEITDTTDPSLKDPNLENFSSVSEAEVKPPYLVGEVRVTKTLPVIETLEENQILRKTIPPNYTFGNFFDNDLLSGMIWSELENSDQIHSIRFTNKQNGEINSITLNLLLHSAREVIVGIQEDDGKGYPSGTWNNEESYVKTVLQSRQDVNYFELPKGFKVSKDKVYHIVIQMVAISSKNLTSEDPTQNIEEETPVLIILYQGNTPHQPFNPEDPDIYWPDPAINSLHYNGVEWTILDHWPTYLLKYVDGTVDGQPYTLKAPWVVRENRAVGQTLIPHSDYKISKLAFVVSKNGNPADDLFYGVKDLNNNLLASGIFAKSDELTKKISFMEISLDDPIDLKAGELYRFYVYSPIPKGDDSYNLFGHEFSFNQTAGYGGQIHRLTTSSDHEHWGDWYDADVVFAFTTEQ